MRGLRVQHGLVVLCEGSDGTAQSGGPLCSYICLIYTVFIGIDHKAVLLKPELIEGLSMVGIVKF